MKTKLNLKKEWVEIADQLADEYYPKGKSDRRGEFIRDQALLYAKFLPIIDDVVNRNARVSTALQVHMIVEDVMEFFTEEMGGFCVDDAYYELIDLTDGMLLGTVDKKEYVKHLEFIFGLDGPEQVATLRQKSDERYKHYRKHGTTITDEDMKNAVEM